MEEKKNISKEDEIDLIELVRLTWSKRKLILKVTVIFLFLGILIALTSKVEYEASCKVLPESQNGGPELGGFGGIAGLAGFDLSGINASASLSPELYPAIVNSAPFVFKLMNEPIYFEKRDTLISSFTYFKEIDSPSLLGIISQYTVGLPGKVKSLFSNSNVEQLKNYNLLRFSKEDWGIIQGYKKRLSVSMDSKTGIIDISAEMPDPVAAAKIADLLVKELTNSVTNYKIEKSQINLEFVEERFNEAKEKYEVKQLQLAKFANKNRNISNSLIKIENERLQNELNIAFEVYKGLASQLEQAEIKVKEETPVFTVLEPVRVPERSKSNKLFIIMIFILSGMIVGITYVSLSNQFHFI
ncbi:Wzz/FepE/Etk N-terminal domain-containing protein [Ekhidna sp.]|uniref:Wzz/FepE/Etk N-terminal domain-containing protein n=1 Tax=Ekhidna sp. TaxID=2608089 RepID=UPI003B51351B